MARKSKLQVTIERQEKRDRIGFESLVTPWRRQIDEAVEKSFEDLFQYLRSTKSMRWPQLHEGVYPPGRPTVMDDIMRKTYKKRSRSKKAFGDK